MSSTQASVDSQQNGGLRNVAILPSSSKPAESDDGDSMEITPPMTGKMGPPAHSSPDMDLHAPPLGNGDASQGRNALSAAAATHSQQPKVVQTAFIHKLYQ